MSRRQTNKFISTKHWTKQWHRDFKLLPDIVITSLRTPDTLYSPVYARRRAYAKRNRAVASHPRRTALGPPPDRNFRRISTEAQRCVTLWIYQTRRVVERLPANQKRLSVNPSEPTVPPLRQRCRRGVFGGWSRLERIDGRNSVSRENVVVPSSCSAVAIAPYGGRKLRAPMIL